MIKEAIATASTIDEAKAKALEELAAPESADVKTEILQAPVKKTLGLFGGAPAKVRVYYEESSFAQAEEYVRTIVKALGVSDVKIKTEADEEGIRMQLDSDEDYGVVIGRRGETLDAIQYLTRLVLNKEDEMYTRVSINIGNYREKREITLCELAKKNAEKVKKYGRSIALDPMNPYERRIVHTTIQEIEGVKSHSVGFDNERRVVITPINQNGNGGGYRKDRRGPKGNNGKRKDGAAKENNTARAPRSDMSGSGLYGKIEPKNITE